MATAASPISPRPNSLAWLRDLLREELSPYPGRGALVARMVSAASIVMVINMTFQIPYGIYGAVYALILSREHPGATLQATKNLIVSFSFAAVYALVGAVFFSGEPMLRLLWVLATLFLIFFALKAVSNYTAAFNFGYLVIVTIPIWDSQISAEQKVVQTLWTVGAVAFATIITTLMEFVYARLRPVNSLASAIVERLQSTAFWLRSPSRGVASPSAEHQLIRLAILGTSRMRRDLLHSSYSPESTQQMGAIVALVGRLVDLGANLSGLSTEFSKTDLQRLGRLADRIEALCDDILSRRTPHQFETLEESPATTVPLLEEMEETVSLIAEVTSGSDSLPDNQPRMTRDQTPSPFFVPDAFSNPAYVRFGIRGGLAASFCYLIYNLVAWQGISTAVTTCLLTALTTIGASRQKQILRFGGAIIGGIVIGFGAQVFVLPALDSIAGFLMLFVAVSVFSAWIITSGPRLSYFGVQIAVAFYLINLQEYKFQTSLAVARDRVAGILLGLVAMWMIFDQLWGASALVAMQRSFVSTLRLLAKLMTPVAKAPGVTVEEAYRLRETISTNFEELRQQADGLMLEFGGSREHNLETRSHLLRWQLQLRIIFVTRIALLRYLLRLPGFEIPEPLLRTQEIADGQLAERLERLADRISEKVPSSLATYDTQLSVASRILYDSNSDTSLAPHSRSFLLLASRITSLLTSLETDMVAHELQFASASPLRNAGRHKELGGSLRSPPNRI
ncbi:multidrug resistance protein MdtO [Edaphobacter modestus]|uniref:Multidrug resistance protein MdtO n=2 Tax=Edaphobacter modestus TaxID=388466 RepID=A0A4Q7YEF5_9BACT|nr:multidrug resistance protein MdtO [Edaphobacter modestus]